MRHNTTKIIKFANEFALLATFIGEQRLFCLSENLENSIGISKSAPVVAPVVRISFGVILSAAQWIYANGCELISFLTPRFFQNLQTKNVGRLTPFCVCLKLPAR